MTIATMLLYCAIAVLVAVGAALLGAVIGARYRARERAREEAREAAEVESQRLTDRHLLTFAGDVAGKLSDIVDRNNNTLANRHAASTLAIVRAEVPGIVKKALDDHAAKGKP